MLSRVELTNFRGFEHLRLDLKPVSVVVGPNSSGKTTALHAIGLALRAYSMVLDAPEAHPVVRKGHVVVCNGLILRDHTLLIPIRDRNELFRNANVYEGATSTVKLSFDAPPIQSISVALSYMRNAVLKLTVTVESSSALEAIEKTPSKSKNRAARLLEVLRTSRPSAVLVPAFYGVTIDEEYRTAPVVDELLQAGQQSSIVRNLVARLSGTDLVELNSFLQRTIGARIVDRTAAADAERVSPLVVRFLDSNGALDLSAAGAGLVNLVALFSALKFRRLSGDATTIFLFDEPEAHLHPRLQGVIGHELATIVRTFANTQMVVATHSVEMINRLGRRDDTVLFSVDRVAAAVKLDSESEIVDAMAAWADLTPFTSLSFLASRRLLFHEGPSDINILGRCADALFGNDPAKLSCFRSWTPAPLDGSGNAPALKALERVIQPKIFPGLQHGRPVRIYLLLDRDRSRVPGTRSSKTGRVESTEVVWGRHSVESLFLEPDVLAMWLAACLPEGGTSEATLREYVAEALTVVDAEHSLLDPAATDLAGELLRPGGVKFQDAMKQALAKVRAEPAIWQKGRDRARRILELVRGKLPHSERRHVRATIADQLADAGRERLSNPSAAVPADVRALLEALAAP